MAYLVLHTPLLLLNQILLGDQFLAYSNTAAMTAERVKLPGFGLPVNYRTHSERYHRLVRDHIDRSRAKHDGNHGQDHQQARLG